MKKLLKSKICKSINSAHHALFIGKVIYFDLKKKLKKKKEEKRRRNVKRAFGKRTNAPLSIVTLVCLLLV